ncbi:hypothetical protein P22_1935 [Propionispora sp. 2/2-37]|uniref:hypothetical protein n=1 Tax=Propionispora sp. 2/2-37 TaxID=1677858 RepID=UPI0006BB7ECB|nr:hypothetical protein [Propionispora sp. 2/2-37]CUH95850.1 hypothetical protein P22_1935 [Propionispora sp. 2/2-37]
MEITKVRFIKKNSKTKYHICDAILQIDHAFEIHKVHVFEYEDGTVKAYTPRYRNNDQVFSFIKFYNPKDFLKKIDKAVKDQLEEIRKLGLWEE